MRSQRTRPSGCAATARDARAVLLGIEKPTARYGSEAHRNTGCVHGPPLATTCLLRGWVPSLKFGFHLVQLRPQLFAYLLPQHREPSIAPLLHADVRKAQEVERLRFPFSTPLPLVDRKRTELQKSRLLGMQFQIELLHSFRKFRPELFSTTSHSYDFCIHYTSPV
jgi:hypothetical protein